MTGNWQDVELVVQKQAGRIIRQGQDESEQGFLSIEILLLFIIKVLENITITSIYS